MRVLLAVLGILLMRFSYSTSSTRAIDGDTFEAAVEIRPGLRETLHVRIECYSAPELRIDGGGVKERDYLEHFLDGGVLLSTTWAHDKYGRLLGEPLKLDGGHFCAGDGGVR